MIWPAVSVFSLIERLSRRVGDCRRVAPAGAAMTIGETLGIARPLVVLDTETTGTDPEKARIVSLGFRFHRPDGSFVDWKSYIDPRVPIPPETTAVHGITDEHVRASPAFAQLAPQIASALSFCDFAGKNVRFDLRVLAAEFARAGFPWTVRGALIVDADRLEQIGEPRTLSDLYRKHMGREPEGAHDALSDVIMSEEVIASQLAKYSAALPPNLAALHALQWPGWIDLEGKFKFIDGVACFGNWGKHKNEPMAQVTQTDPGYWDFILRKDFSAEAKQIAAEAKLGRYPTETKAV